MYHIQENLKIKYRGKDIVTLFRKAVKAYSFQEFEKFIIEIESKSYDAWEYLTEMGIEHWARSHFLGRRYNMMTSNNAESLNALFKKDRELPILAMLENIRDKLQQWFHDRREESQCCISVLTPTQEDKLFKTLDVARKVCVEPLDQFRFFVRCARNFGYIIDLNNNTCTCRQFQLESFPCTRAVAVAMYRGILPHTLCSAYYTTGSWRVAYVETIFPVPNEVEWEVLGHILSLNNLLSPALSPRTPECIRTSKIPSIGEFLRPCKCDRYGATGHTKRFCTSQISLHDNVTDV
ncbi:uncharacterized protein LOC111382004 [Olea europaea var. sylvestris]|uniref:uncharacterized protein LOC111382004 n=1 Tax=Olea europaea var. sylvestris TaxID=158386 RepID=UPI000C1CF1A6|nr:uncharacterized protein LOC111382004 [Olea europaea var. sylvestris]